MLRTTRRSRLDGHLSLAKIRSVPCARVSPLPRLRSSMTTVLQPVADGTTCSSNMRFNRSKSSPSVTLRRAICDGVNLPSRLTIDSLSGWDIWRMRICGPRRRSLRGDDHRAATDGCLRSSAQAGLCLASLRLQESRLPNPN